MIPDQPIDLTVAAPFDPLSYFLHIGIGLLAIAAALIALFARKGGLAHRYAGWIFAASTVVIAATSIAMLTVRMAPPLALATVTAIYAVATALLALRSPTATVRRTEYVLSAIQTLVLLLFFAASVPLVLDGRLPAIGPVIVGLIPVLLLIGDVMFYRRADDRVQLRVNRHLVRMIWGLIVIVRAGTVEVNVVLQIPVPVILYAPILIGFAGIWFATRHRSARHLLL